MEQQSDPAKATADYIEKFVEDHWQDQRNVCYLSSIGTAVMQNVRDGRTVLSNGLRDFLRTNPIVHVVQFPGVDQKVGAVPLSVKIPEDVKPLFEKRKSVDLGNTRNSYVQDFWDAFIKSIDEGQRFVCINSDGDIEITTNEKSDENWNCYEIASSDLSSGGPSLTLADRVAHTHDTIGAWLEKHGLTAQVFAPSERTWGRERRSDRLSILLSAFEGLDSKDFSRIQIPLDILIKLNTAK